MKSRIYFSTNMHSSSLENYAQEYFEKHMHAFNDHIASYEIHFSDINGDRGGVDKRCQIMCQLREPGQLTAHAEAEGYEHALADCFKKLLAQFRSTTGKAKNIDRASIRG